MSFRDRLVFDPDRGEYRDGDIRYLMLRHDALMGLFAELPPPARLPALEALGRSIRTHGGRSAAAYQAAGAAEPGQLLATIAATAPELGWGRWAFRQDGPRLCLDVTNSPFAAAGPAPHPVCHAICGMLEAIGPAVLGTQVTVAETRCAAQAGGEVCTFEMSGLSAPPATV